MQRLLMFLSSSSLQVLLLSTSRMIVMLLMPSGGLTRFHLVMTGVGCPWSGQGLEDIKRHFEPYGEITNVRIRRNFAFVQFEMQEDATKALESTHLSKILDRVVSVEYALRDDDASPKRVSYRSPSPVYRRRPSPDYGRPHSPVYDKYSGAAAAYGRRPSPDYTRSRSPFRGRNRSPVYDRFRSRSPMRRSR
ncbi:Serine/arginine-rich splicing factor RS31 [Linum perenne]